MIRAENIGGDIEKAPNQHFRIGAFPWRHEGLEECPCRVICFSDCGGQVEAIGNPRESNLFRRF